MLTNYLSEQKLKKGIVNELTKNKGIEIQIHTRKILDHWIALRPT